MKRFGVIFAALALSACVGQPTPAVFSAQDSNYVLVNGSGIIQGRAYVARNGQTINGFRAVLLPATPYHVERMRTLYAGTNQKVLGQGNDPPAPEGFTRYQREVNVAPDGTFRFTGVTPGRYIVLGIVEVPGQGRPQIVGVYDSVTVPASGPAQVMLAGV